jgi:hypothetical protein
MLLRGCLLRPSAHVKNMYIFTTLHNRILTFLLELQPFERQLRNVHGPLYV